MQNLLIFFQDAARSGVTLGRAAITVGRYTLRVIVKVFVSL